MSEKRDQPVDQQPRREPAAARVGLRRVKPFGEPAVQDLARPLASAFEAASSVWESSVGT